jgi:hypothetical protein
VYVLILKLELLEFYQKFGVWDVEKLNMGAPEDN